MLPRHDVLTLITPYVDDLVSEDQHDLGWMVWHLSQDDREFKQHGVVHDLPPCRPDHMYATGRADAGAEAV